MKSTASVFTIIVCGVILAGCNSAQSNTGGPPSGGMPAMLVKLAPVTSRVLDDSSTFVGTLKSRKSVNLRPQVDSRVLQIFVRSGDVVAAGAPLLELDKSKQETLVSNASAAIESSIAEQESARATVKSLQSSKLSKIAAARFAEKQHARYKKLADEGAVSIESVDYWRNQFNIAQADTDAVEAQIRAQQAILNKATKQIMQARAAMNEQQEQLRYFTVRAPFAGEVGDVPVRVGDYVTTQTTLTTVDQPKPLELYVSIPTTAARRLHKGLMAQIVTEDGKVEEQGNVFFVAAQVDPRDQCILVKAEIANTTERLRSGQQVNARLVWGNAPTLTVPVTAVTRFTGQDFVFVANKAPDGKLTAKQKAVKLAAIEGNEYRVVSGLEVGEEVVTSGTQNLSDGIPIKTGS
jgi:multidrug efflux pump subunit AcrA (membrane-fusion protein)